MANFKLQGCWKSEKCENIVIYLSFGKHERDTATPAVTACALCEHVLSLLTHIKKHKNDMTAFMKLQRFLTKRRRYLLYLKHYDFNSYSYVIKYYGLKDYDESMSTTFKRMRRRIKVRGKVQTISL